MTDTKEYAFHNLYTKHRNDRKESFSFSFWHYTNIDGLMGIVRNSEADRGKIHFWFTRCDCLNDTSEGNYIIALYKKVCNELLDSKVISKEFYDGIIDLEIPDEQFINFPLPQKEERCYNSMLDCVPCDAFVCSFSLKEDSLDMWRYYSKGKGGYGLKFIYHIFDEQQKYEIKSYDSNAKFSCLKAFKVIYNSDEQKQILKTLLTDAYDVYFKFPDCISRIQGFVRSELKDFQFRFKHECFESEQEYRYVFYRPKKKPQNLENDLPEIKYRSQDGMMIPYLDIEVSKNAHVAEVLISPFIKNETALTTIKEYIKSCGFNNCKVRMSELPVR